jgi:hypothetical protein
MGLVTALARDSTVTSKFGDFIDDSVLRHVACAHHKMIRATCAAGRNAATRWMLVSGDTMLHGRSLYDMERLTPALYNVVVCDEQAAQRIRRAASVREIRVERYNNRCTTLLCASIRSRAFESLVSLNMRNAVIDVAFMRVFWDSILPLCGQIRHLELPRVETSLGTKHSAQIKAVESEETPLACFVQMRTFVALGGYSLLGGEMPELTHVQIASPMCVRYASAVASSPKLKVATLALRLDAPNETFYAHGTSIGYLVLENLASSTLDALRALTALCMVCVTARHLVDCSGAFHRAHTVIVVAGPKLRSGLHAVFNRENAPRLRRVQIGSPSSLFGATVLALSDIVDISIPTDALLDRLFAMRNARHEVDVKLFLKSDHPILSGAPPWDSPAWRSSDPVEHKWLRQTLHYRW